MGPETITIITKEGRMSGPKVNGKGCDGAIFYSIGWMGGLSDAEEHARKCTEKTGYIHKVVSTVIENPHKDLDGGMVAGLDEHKVVNTGVKVPQQKTAQGVTPFFDEIIEYSFKKALEAIEKAGKKQIKGTARFASCTKWLRQVTIRDFKFSRTIDETKCFCGDDTPSTKSASYALGQIQVDGWSDTRVACEKKVEKPEPKPEPKAKKEPELTPYERARYERAKDPWGWVHEPK